MYTNFQVSGARWENFYVGVSLWTWHCLLSAVASVQWFFPINDVCWMNFYFNFGYKQNTFGGFQNEASENQVCLTFTCHELDLNLLKRNRRKLGKENLENLLSGHRSRAQFIVIFTATEWSFIDLLLCQLWERRLSTNSKKISFYCSHLCN